MPVSGSCLYLLSVPVLRSSVLLSMSAVFMLVLRLLVLLSVSAIFMAMPGLSVYIFYFFYYKPQPKYQPRAFTLNKKLINIALYLLSQLLLINHPLYHLLYPLPPYCSN